jgi:hypothetical protein
MFRDSSLGTRDLNNHIDTFLKRELALPVHIIENPENAVITGGKEALKFIPVYERSVPRLNT